MVDNQIKAKIKTSMEQLLVSKGWPDKLNTNGIIQLLPDLWKKLESEGLLKSFTDRGFTYKNFVDAALAARARQDAFEHMAAFFRGR